MAKYLRKRILISVIILFLILLILFLLLQFMPGSPFNDEKLSPEQVAVLKESYGLDKPVPVQFIRYVGNMLRGDLGVSYSISPNTPITVLLANRFPVTLRIGFLSLIFGTLAGVLLGLSAAFFKSRIIKGFYSILTMLGVAVPSYLFAMYLSWTLGYKAKVLPMLYDFRSPAISSVMPVAALSFVVMAVIARFTKAEAEEVKNSDYVMLARCSGLNNRTIILQYILRNSLIPVITVMGSLLVGLLTGSLVIEKMFSIPGVGSLLTNAISSNDYSVVISLSFVYSALYIIIMLILDIIYCVVDPRIRLTGADLK